MSFVTPNVTKYECILDPNLDLNPITLTLSLSLTNFDPCVRLSFFFSASVSLRQLLFELFVIPRKGRFALHSLSSFLRRKETDFTGVRSHAVRNQHFFTPNSSSNNCVNATYGVYHTSDTCSNSNNPPARRNIEQHLSHPIANARHH